LGQLVAGIAHEINNPVSFVHGNLHHASEYATELLEAVIAYQDTIDRHNQQYAKIPHFVPIAHPETLDLDYIADDFPKLLTSMRVGTNRIREIVKSLRIYSHVTTEAKEPASLHESIDRVLMILSHRIQELKPDLNIIRQSGSLPAVDCTIGQIDQVLINLLVNAIDAIEERWQAAPPAQELPTITITTQTLNLSWVKIEITDNGIGMNDATRAKLFDPFYTTKPVGKGTGLGMAIAYQIIVERHYGSIDCRSIPHHGTTFEIKLPITRDIASAATSA
jgi:signal transduction histidine kinase